MIFIKLSNVLAQNIDLFKKIFKGDDTIKFREIQNKYNRNLRYCIIYADGMINKQVIVEYIIEQLMDVNLQNLNIIERISPKNILDIIAKNVINVSEVKKEEDIDKMIGGMLYGDTIVLMDGVNEALVLDSKGWPTRTINEPPSEKKVKGPREGFTESIITNTTLIRRKVKNKDLKFTFMELGEKTKTKIALCYLDKLVLPDILEELKRRLSKINIDGVLESQYIEEFISDAPLSIFKTIGSTESPDTAAGKILEGRIVLLCDGTPFVLTLPYIFIEYFQSYEDYYNNYIFSSFNRILRIFAFFLSISVPSLYVAITSFHQELIPTSLLLSIYASRIGIPFPTIVEAVFMLIGFDILREAGARLPEPIGQAVSIIGALVLGDAAVNARIVSAPMVIVTALTGLASFLLPNMVGVLIIIRFILLILSSILGLYGYIFGIMALFIYLVSIRSFGIPYMMNSSIIRFEDMRDASVRKPWPYMNFRPKLFNKDRQRQRKIKN
ncbi:spore germination protein KA [Clostridium sp. USBA 49]|uniref:spore germination protein n=1 Tax=Clostridium sp. USBA 49 TaxID=1881060 RepID=UPI00099A3258|nr:spore germination protein [Clostridium sp. USBA 49]SKA91183.1 spore germination protein KA [Clostridium sp. USBA 49]